MRGMGESKPCTYRGIMVEGMLLLVGFHTWLGKTVLTWVLDRLKGGYTDIQTWHCFPNLSRPMNHKRALNGKQILTPESGVGPEVLCF